MTTREENRPDGIMGVYAGASRMGKTTALLETLKPMKRIIARDPRCEYGRLPGWETVKTITELATMLSDTGTGKRKIAFFGANKDFSDFCELAYVWGMQWPCAIVAEELGDVSQSGKAVDAFGELIRKGLYYGNHIYAVAQRPQEITKTLTGNMTFIHTHGFMQDLDVKYMLGLIGCKEAELKALQKGQWLERWQGEKTIRTGKTAPPKS